MDRRTELSGIGLALVSATAFGATAIIAKLAYRQGVDVATLLAARFALGASMLWGLVFAARIPRALPRGHVWTFLALGAFGYATQSRLVFESLKRIPAGTAILLLYAYPALVALIAVALGREKLGWAKAGVLALGLAGVGLVLGRPSGGSGFGVSLALAGAVGYAIYITIVQRAAAGVHPLLSSAVIITGGAISFATTGIVGGQIHFDVGLAGWGWVVLMAFVSVTVAVSTFLASVSRIGPTRASIASTWEPVVAVLLAALILGEHLSLPQLMGGACVVAAVALLPLTSRINPGELEMPVSADETTPNSSGKSWVT